MGCAEGMCAGIDRPAGVTRTFHVVRQSVEPSKRVLASNLLANDQVRSALAAEAKHLGPQVALVGCPFPLTGSAKGLARTGAGPDAEVVRDTSSAKSQAPDSHAREQMHLPESSEVIGSNIDN